MEKEDYINQRRVLPHGPPSSLSMTASKEKALRDRLGRTDGHGDEDVYCIHKENGDGRKERTKTGMMGPAVDRTPDEEETKKKKKMC